MGDKIIEFWVLWAMGLIGTAITVYIRKRIKKVEVRQEIEIRKQIAIEAGMQALLRDRLIQSYNYHKEKGYCEIHNRDNITNMYKQYHNLGENGVIDRLMDELLDLPVKEVVTNG